MAEAPSLVRINFATLEELREIPGVGIKTAAFLIGVRERLGNIDRQSFLDMLPLKVKSAMLDCIDFSPNKINSDFGDDLDSDDSDGDIDQSVNRFRGFLEALKGKKGSFAKPPTDMPPMGQTPLRRHPAPLSRSFQDMGDPLRAPGVSFADPSSEGRPTSAPLSSGWGRPTLDDVVSHEPAYTASGPGSMGVSDSMPFLSRIGGSMTSTPNPYARSPGSLVTEHSSSQEKYAQTPL